MCLLNDSSSGQQSPSVIEDRNLGSIGCNKYQCQRELSEPSLHFPTLPLTLLHGHCRFWHSKTLVWPPGSGNVKGYMTFLLPPPNLFPPHSPHKHNLSNISHKCSLQISPPPTLRRNVLHRSGRGDRSNQERKVEPSTRRKQGSACARADPTLDRGVELAPGRGS